MLKNVEESLNVLPFMDLKTSKVVLKTVTFLEKQISELQYQMDEITNEEFKSQIESLTSI